jgi:hypothetical protein
VVLQPLARGTLRLLINAMDTFRPALRALLISLGGAALAWAWFAGEWPIRIFLLVLAALIAIGGLGMQHLGDKALPDHPERAVRLLGWRLITVAVLASVAAAAVIVVTVMLAADKATGQTKELLAALTTAITSFLTTMFSIDEKADERIGDFIRGRFEAHYDRDPGDPAKRKSNVRYFAPESPGERWVYSAACEDVSGWGKEARRKRAKGVAEALPTATA